MGNCIKCISGTLYKQTYSQIFENWDLQVICYDTGQTTKTCVVIAIYTTWKTNGKLGDSFSLIYIFTLL